MNHSTNPPLSVTLGANHLHGVLRVDQIRTDALVQLVQHWASDEQSRDDVIDALDELAAVVGSVAREGELDAAVEQVEDVAGMDTAHVEVDIPNVCRLLGELEAVERVTSRFNRGASLIKHPTHAKTRAHLKAHPFPKQDGRRSA
ncbi:hypothetical protein [Streptomyces adelaidensis]|uniref:hypothetical protein n=1 Tax=Streptomyces adelaidensis TaxID=2796465 RepID=UPI0019064B0A|nr:hypothetical protein [Streptomyces adelaidensis]